MRRATIYRKAAEHVAKHYPVGTCCAVYAVQHGGVDGFACLKLDSDEATIAYIRTMSASGTDCSDFTEDMFKTYGKGSEDAFNHRLLSLCFMAAMAEAGDV